MKRVEKINTVNEFMNLVYEYGNAQYLLGKVTDENKELELWQESDNIKNIIKFELYAMIDRLEREK